VWLVVGAGSTAVVYVQGVAAPDGDSDKAEEEDERRGGGRLTA
jgi:hypothetical protein